LKEVTWNRAAFVDLLQPLSDGVEVDVEHRDESSHVVAPFCVR
jgi:hypothetical protein